ncbi:MAG: hypothetical protein AABW65_02455 [Nanoarchaeota archaeon]
MASISKLFDFIRPKFEESSILEEKAIILDVQHIPPSFISDFTVDSYGHPDFAYTLINLPEQFLILLRGSVHKDITFQGYYKNAKDKKLHERLQNNKGKEVIVYYRDIYKVKGKNDSKKIFHHYDVLDIQLSKEPI